MRSPDPNLSATALTTAPASAGPSGATVSSPTSQADGRRILSTAFVQIGPDGHLTVELRDGSTLVLRDVRMGPRDYCGTLVSVGRRADKFCGAYGDVAGARPGGGPRPGGAASLDPLPMQ